MDLYAYSQIDALDKIAKANGINISRCRGYRLMSDEKVIDKDEINEILKESEYDAVEWAAAARWKYHPLYLVLDDKWMKKHANTKTYTVRWDTIHGYQRKMCKFCCKKVKKRILENLSMFNKYVGRDDVLYIHAKRGSCSWSDPWWVYKNEPWFLEACDDYYDRAYCDIYARIKPLTDEEKKGLKDVEND